MIDREKDKDRDKEKEKSILKAGLSETKENVKKLMGKDKQNSKALLPIEPESQIHNNADLKNSPMLLIKRSNDIIPDGGNDLTILNEKTLPDIVNMNKIDSTVSTHGIISPFEPLNDDSDSDEAILEHPHQQLSSSSSASVNIMMDSSNNKIIGNVQVSQV